MTTRRDQGAVDLATQTAAKIEPDLKLLMDKVHGRDSLDRGISAALRSWDQTRVEITTSRATKVTSKPAPLVWRVKRVFGFGNH